MTSSILTAAVPTAVKFQGSVVDTQALTLSGGAYGNTINGMSFQQDAIVTDNGWQYITYYNTDGHVCVARRQLPQGTWEKLILTDYTFLNGSQDNDAHNIISMGICPNDGTIHLSFDHHGSTLHYRLSQTGVTTNPETITWDARLFGSTRNYLEVGKSVSGVTYPRFWHTPDGNLQMCYRVGGSGSGNIILVDYDAVQGLWENTRMVISRYGSYSDACGSSSTRNAYLNYPFYGPDGTLNVTWCWREGAGGTNHDICYAYSNDGGVIWYNGAPPEQSVNIHAAPQQAPSQSLLNLSWTSTGQSIVGQATGNSSTEQLIDLNSDAIAAVQINRQYSLMNQQSQAIDPQGRVHTVMWYATDGAGCNVWASSGRDYHHYWRDLEGQWHHFKLPVAVGSRPKLFIRENGDAFLVFIRSGSLVIAAASAQSQWTDWQEIAVDNTYSLAGEGLGDVYRFKNDGTLSVMAQETSTLRVFDWQLN